MSCDTLEMKHSQATQKINVNVNTLHELLGHPSEAMMRKIAKELNVILTGIVEPCKACILGKAKEPNVSTITHKCSAMIGEMLFIDISVPTVKSLGGKRHWLLVVNDFMNCAWSYLLKEKSVIAITVNNFITQLKA